MTNPEASLRQLLSLAAIEINGANPWDMQVHDKRVFAQLLKGGSLALGETYMDGWWSTSALDQLICKVLQADLAGQLKQQWRLALQLFLNKVFNRQSLSRAKQVANVHYNLDNELYGYMLGPSMSYTCAYFKDTDSLDLAQHQKHDLICRKLNLKPGNRILELGCGWGGFAEFAAKHYGCELVSVNISTEQIAYAKERCKGLPVSLHLCDYRDHKTYNPSNERFDSVVSIGMCEHVGYKNYAHFLQLAHQQLKPHGLFLLHTIGGNISTVACEPWTQKYIFPNGMLPSIQQLGTAMENLFVMEDWHNFGPYYDPTLMSWQRNFEASWDKLKHRYDDRFYRMWNYYLLSCAGMFRARGAQLWQVILSKGNRPGIYQAVR